MNCLAGTCTVSRIQIVNVAVSYNIWTESPEDGFSCDGAQKYHACVQGSTNGTNGIPISFKVLPMVPLVKSTCKNRK